jgi:hypothetical protein
MSDRSAQTASSNSAPADRVPDVAAVGKADDEAAQHEEQADPHPPDFGPAPDEGPEIETALPSDDVDMVENHPQCRDRAKNLNGYKQWFATFRHRHQVPRKLSDKNSKSDRKIVK